MLIKAFILSLLISVGQPIQHTNNRPREIFRTDSYVGIADPWIMQYNNKYIMYRCQNSDNADRIWRAESFDGIHNWTGDRVVLEGRHPTRDNLVSDQDDLSCSPGVVVTPAGVWHMYYITGPRGTPEQMCGIGAIEMWHATSNDGITWNKQGKIEAVPPADCSLLEPSPIIEGSKIGVYFVSKWLGYGKVRLWRMESDILDGHFFTSPSPCGRIEESRNGRVSKVGETYYFVYSNVKNGEDTQCNEVHLSSGPSTDFTEGPVIVQATPGTFYSTFVSGSNYVESITESFGKIYLTGDYLPSCLFDQYIPGVCCTGFNALGVLNYPYTTQPNKISSQEEPASLEGQVTPPMFAPGFQFYVTQNGVEYEVTSDANGHYKLEGLKTGPATVSYITMILGWGGGVNQNIILRPGINELNIRVW